MQWQSERTLNKTKNMTEYLDWQLVNFGVIFVTIALLLNLLMAGMCALFYFCWSKVFWNNEEKTKCQPLLLKKDIEAA